MIVFLVFYISVVTLQECGYLTHIQTMSIPLKQVIQQMN